MSEKKIEPIKEIFTGAGGFAEKIRSRWNLAGGAIAGVLGLVLGVLYMRSDGPLDFIDLAVIGLGLFTLLGIVWLTGRSGGRPRETVRAPETKSSDWLQGQETYGFYVEHGQTEIRFLDWDKTHHREVYEKYLKVMPIRDGEILIDVLSGSSAVAAESGPSETDKLRINHTHEFERMREDQYHIRNRVRAHAKKGEAIELVDKSTRSDISNDASDTHSEVKAHPRLTSLDVVKPDKWYAVIHVLYPTKKLSFRAELVGEHKALTDSIKIHEFTDSTEKPVAEKVHFIGEEEGTLQFLRWEKDFVEANTNFVIHWRWRNPT